MSIIDPPRTLTGTDLETKIRKKTAIVGVIGLGYVGLPLVEAFVNAGYRTMASTSTKRRSTCCSQQDVHRSHQARVD